MSSASDNSRVFVALDGDRVGDTLEYLLVSRDIEGVERFSQAVMEYFGSLARHFTELGAAVHFCTGDDLLISFPTQVFVVASVQYLPQGPCTTSVGIGRDSCTAFLALKAAKARGRDRVIAILDMEHGEPHEYELIQ